MDPNHAVSKKLTTNLLDALLHFKLMCLYVQVQLPSLCILLAGVEPSSFAGPGSDSTEINGHGAEHRGPPARERDDSVSFRG